MFDLLAVLVLVLVLVTVTVLVPGREASAMLRATRGQ
jgi:uncharacterized protein YpmS